MRRLFILVSLILAPTPSLADPIFLDLGYLPGGSLSSEAYAISADGSVVVGYSGSDNEAFRWTQSGGMVSLGGSLGSLPQTYPRGVSADGSVVAGWRCCVGGDQAAWRWTQAGGLVSLGTLPGTDFAKSSAVSADGEVVVGYAENSSRVEAFRWTQADGMVGLGDLPDGRFESIANGVSADGSVVVGRGTTVRDNTTSLFFEAFRWTDADGMVGLGRIPGSSYFSVAHAVSGDGNVVVGEGGAEAFRWTELDGMVGLGDLPGGDFRSKALAASFDGSVIVGQSQGRRRVRHCCGLTLPDPEAFVWDEVSGMLSVPGILENSGIDLSGWRLNEATGVSADGTTIVGNGYYRDSPRAWLAVIVIPEPSTAVLSLIGLALMAATSRRRDS